jgi:predicted kinase
MWRLTHHKEWTDIRNEFEWIRDMAGVPQDKLYHEEGDVEIHTRMVMEALLDLPEYKALDEQDKAMLFASALLHDVEKRSTTVHEPDGRITSRGHSKKGELTSRRMLYMQHAAPFAIREEVAMLVRHHQLPLWAIRKDDPAKAVIRASLEVNTAHLAMLAKADVLGRIARDRQEMLDRIELFIELCKENDCYGKPRGFASGLARFYYLHREEATPDYVPFDDTKFEVVMLSALPGTGKDMHILERYRDWSVVSPDGLRREMKVDPRDERGNGRVIQAAKEKAKQLMRQHTPFVWNATNFTVQMRGQLIDLFTSYGGKVKIAYLEVPYSTLMRQNSDREHPVPRKAIDKMIHKLEVPTPVEAHEVEHVVREE